MKHLSVKLEGTPEHDEKGSYGKIFRDRSGDDLVLSDLDAKHWMARMLELELESSDWAVTRPLAGHVINFNGHKSVVVNYMVSDTLILTIGGCKELIRADDICTETTGVEPSEEYKDGQMVPTWNLVGFDLEQCSCGTLVPLAVTKWARGTWAICALCSL